MLVGWTLGVTIVGALAAVSVVLRVVGELVERLDRQDQCLGRLEHGLLRTSQTASAQRVGLALMGRLRDRLSSVGSRLALEDTTTAPPGDGPDDAAGDDARRGLMRDVETCAGLLDRYERLAVVREGPVTVRPIDVDSVVDDVLSLLEWELYLRRIGVVRDLPAGLPPAMGDAGRLRQVLQNLLLNAVEAIGRDGTIRLAVETGDGELRLSVVDSGPGLALDALDRIFEPLFSTRAEGVGLGLTVCRDLVARMGGRLVAGNDERGGAAFVVHLRAAVPVPGL